MNGKRPISPLRTEVRVSETGLVRSRHYLPLTRREFGLGAAAAVGAAAVGLPGTNASAATGINFMGWQGYDDGINVDNWLEKNGIELKPTYIGTNEEIIAAASAGGVGTMDIATPAEIYLPVYRAAGILEPLDLDRIPNYAGIYPEIKDFMPIDEGNTVIGLPFVWGDVPLMYNAEVIQEPPDSWHALTDERYKGRVGMVYDVMGIMVHSPLAATSTKTPTRITQEELDQTIAWLIKIKKEYARTVVPSYGELAALFANGEVVIAPAWTPTAAWAGEDAPKLDWVIPKEGALVFVDIFSMIRDAPHKDLNYKILNHTLSPEAQANTANLNLTAVTVEDAVPLLDELPRSLYHYEDIAGWFEKTGGPYPPWSTEQEGDFLNYDQILQGWERFLQA